MFIFMWTQASWCWWEAAAASFFIKTAFFYVNKLGFWPWNEKKKKSTSPRSYWRAMICVLGQIERLIISKDCTESINGSFSGEIHEANGAEAPRARNWGGPLNTQPQLGDRWAGWRKAPISRRPERALSTMKKIHLLNRLETQQTASEHTPSASVPSEWMLGLLVGSSAELYQHFYSDWETLAVL